MTREIKFRFWNGKSIEDVGEIDFFTDGGLNINSEYPLFANESEGEKRYGKTDYKKLIKK